METKLTLKETLTQIESKREKRGRKRQGKYYGKSTTSWSLWSPASQIIKRPQRSRLGREYEMFSNWEGFAPDVRTHLFQAITRYMNGLRTLSSFTHPQTKGNITKNNSFEVITHVNPRLPLYSIGSEFYRVDPTRYRRDEDFILGIVQEWTWAKLAYVHPDVWPNYKTMGRRMITLRERWELVAGMYTDVSPVVLTQLDSATIRHAANHQTTQVLFHRFLNENVM